MIVDAAKLPEIRQLARTADVGDGREERVLDQRPQQHVRAEMLGRLFALRRSGPAAGTMRRRRGIARRVLDGLASAVEMEQRDAVLLRA